jgi:putative acetyltransferase
MIDIRRSDPRDFLALLKVGDDYAASLYPAESNHMLDVETLLNPNMHFFGVWRGVEKLGCGGFWTYGDYVEIKRVWLEPAARGLGLSRQLMLKLEQEASALGFTSARLETGVKQQEALGLYRAIGYEQCAEFGEYSADPLSVFMVKLI